MGSVLLATVLWMTVPSIAGCSKESDRRLDPRASDATDAGPASTDAGSDVGDGGPAVEDAADVPPSRDANDVSGDGPATKSSATIEVTVLDVDGRPIPGATVDLGPRTKTTGPEGGTRFVGVDPDMIWTPVVRREGYAPTAVTIANLEDGAEVSRMASLVPTEDIRTFDPTDATTLIHGPLRLELPADALADRDGDPPGGEVHAAIATVDPTEDSSSSRPEGRDDRPHRSLGSVAVQLFERDGGSREPLHLASSASASVEYVVPEEAEDDFSKGETVAVSAFDPAAGRWRDELTGEIRDSTFASGRLAWMADVDHFSWWRSGESVPSDETGCLLVELKGSNAPGAEVGAIGPDEGTLARAAADPGGQACLNVPVDARVRVAVRSPEAMVPARRQIRVETTRTGSCAANQSACKTVTVDLRDPTCVAGNLQPPAGARGDTHLHTVWETPIGSAAATTTIGRNGSFCAAIPTGRDVELQSEFVASGGRRLRASTTVAAGERSASCVTSPTACDSVASDLVFEATAGPPSCPFPNDRSNCPNTGAAARITQFDIQTSTQAAGIDIDGDGRTDSALGDALQQHTSVLGLDADAAMAKALNSGALHPVLEARHWNGPEDRHLSLAMHWASKTGSKLELGPSASGQLHRASTHSGRLRASLGSLLLKLPLGPAPAAPVLDLRLREPTLEADIGARAHFGAGGEFQLKNGRLGGWVTTADLVDALNRETGSNGACTCISGDLVGPDLACRVDSSDAAACRSGSRPVCRKLATPKSCARTMEILRRARDADTDGDGTADAWSMGAAIEARGAAAVRSP
ncbi:MAG: carboxypeptidase-like regulatory domain-containing protein [Bradymonadaceae bacterium]